MKDWKIIIKKFKKFRHKNTKINFAKVDDEELMQYYVIFERPKQFFNLMDEGKQIEGFDTNEQTYIKVANFAKKCDGILDKIIRTTIVRGKNTNYWDGLLKKCKDEFYFATLYCKIN